MSEPTSAAVRSLVRLPGRYWVAISAYVVPLLATFVARAILGDDPTAAEVDNLGFGLPAFEDGRWWTLFTGFVLVDDLAVPPPTLILLGVAAYEHVAGPRTRWGCCSPGTSSPCSSGSRCSSRSRTAATCSPGP